MLVDALRTIGAGEMGHLADRAQHALLLQKLGALEGRRIGRRAETQPVHAAVQLEHDVHLARQARPRQHVELLAVMHAGAQVIAVDDVQVGGFEETLQQQDRTAPAGLAAAHRLVQVQHRQPLRRGEPRHRLFDAVAVGIGLDDGPDGRRQALGRRGRLIQVAAHRGQVVGKRGNGNGGGYGTRHDGEILSRGEYIPEACGASQALRADRRSRIRGSPDRAGGWRRPAPCASFRQRPGICRRTLARCSRSSPPANAQGITTMRART